MAHNGQEKAEIRENKKIKNKVVLLPNYILQEDKSYETIGKAQVDQHFLVEDKNLSKEALKSLLEELYKKASQVDDWKYHDKPTVIVLKLYISKQHVVSGNYIAELSKVPLEDSPEIRIDERQFENLNQPTQKKFGLEEEDRKKIYMIQGQAQIEAYDKADKLYPDFGLEHTKMFENLLKKFDKKISQTYNLTDEQSKEIFIEGMSKNWPEYFSRKPTGLFDENQEIVVKTFTGSGMKNTRPFTVQDGWEIQWDAKGDIFQLCLYTASGDMVGVPANQQGSGKGSSFQPKAGN